MYLDKLNDFTLYYEKALQEEKINSLFFPLNEEFLKEQSKNIILEKLIREQFIHYYSEFPRVSNNTTDYLKKKLNFKASKKDILDYCENQLSILERVYHDDVYVKRFNIDDFHKKIFTHEGRFFVVENLIETVLERLNKEPEFDLTKINDLKDNKELILRLGDICNKVIDDFKSEVIYAFITMTELKSLQIILYELKPEDYIEPSPIISKESFQEQKSQTELKQDVNFKDEKRVSNEDILEKQNLLTPHISIKKVLEYFKVLTQMTNKHNEFYLTDNQLLFFVKSTFVDLQPVKQNFNCKGFIKKDVRKVFYKFYFDNKNQEKNQTALKRKYFNILNNSLYGFNEVDYIDFAK